MKNEVYIHVAKTLPQLLSQIHAPVPLSRCGGGAEQGVPHAARQPRCRQSILPVHGGALRTAAGLRDPRSATRSCPDPVPCTLCSTFLIVFHAGCWYRTLWVGPAGGEACRASHLTSLGDCAWALFVFHLTQLRETGVMYTLVWTALLKVSDLSSIQASKSSTQT